MRSDDDATSCLIAGGVRCCNPRINLHCHLLDSATQLVITVPPPPQLLAALKAAVQPTSGSMPQARQQQTDSKRRLQVTNILLDVSDALVSMQTAYVVPQHVSERHVKLLLGCQQQIQLQRLHLAGQPNELGFTASLRKLQMISLQESAEQLGRGEMLSTRRSDMMDTQIKDILTGLQPIGSMPQRTASGQSTIQAGVHKNQFFSIASLTASGSAAGLVTDLGKASAANVEDGISLDMNINSIGVRFEPDDAFAACAAYRDVAAVVRVLTKHTSSSRQDAAAQGRSCLPRSSIGVPISTEAKTRSSAQSPA